MYWTIAGWVHKAQVDLYILIVEFSILLRVYSQSQIKRNVIFSLVKSEHRILCCVRWFYLTLCYLYIFPP
jgi:hypothetical protein